ncbi:MAG: hypothetical protein IT366_05415 [Candidatus Hydrogenedentes bacterium]|nr:hypothetical protein [Candidatus Hydrogenedentota bacterium]
MKRKYVILCACLCTTVGFADDTPVRAAQSELGYALRTTPEYSRPGMACWFWQGDEFQPEGYKKFIDLHREHSAVTLLTTSIRHPVEVTDPAVHDQIKRAAEYAKANDMAIVMDLDVRLARQAFQDSHPDELQEIACLREIPLTASGEVQLSVDSIDLSDHYTFGSAKTYCTVSSRLLRAYAYSTGPDGIEPDSIEDITELCRVVQADSKGLNVAIPCDSSLSGKTACVIAAFTLFTPDVFAPHLIEFERNIMKQYSDVPLAGACKDEWGFPGRFKVNTDDLWYSDAMAHAYAERYPPRDLVPDLLLMAKKQRGREQERLAVINCYMELSWKRHAEVENKFYYGVKETFGQSALSATHPTWYPYPGELEAIKNGLDWWACERDLAQTDESTPFSARTSLTKKWISPLWYNMYYSTTIEAYQRELWSSVLAGGRINFHPLYPAPLADGNTAILRGDLMRAEQRIRLLNYISSEPVECPVLILFGHLGALNWVGDSFGKTGVEIANELWEAGYYTDLMPTSEIRSVTMDGGSGDVMEWMGIRSIRNRNHWPNNYSPSSVASAGAYDAVVFYRPEFDEGRTMPVLRHLSLDAKTALFRVGEWNLDLRGRPLEAASALNQRMRAVDEASCAREVIAYLKAKGVEPQTPGRMRGEKGFPDSVVPQSSGYCRLSDGTTILASGEKELMGDPIQKTIKVRGFEVTVDAIGVVGIQLREDGTIYALAAGGLKTFKSAAQSIELPERLDIAFFKEPGHEPRGIVHGYDGPIPDALLTLTKDWTRVRVPTPYVDPPASAN